MLDTISDAEKKTTLIKFEEEIAELSENCSKSEEEIAELHFTYAELNNDYVKLQRHSNEQTLQIYNLTIILNQYKRAYNVDDNLLDLLA